MALKKSSCEHKLQTGERDATQMQQNICVKPDVLEPHRHFNVLIIGPFCSGKSSLVHTLINCFAIGKEASNSAVACGSQIHTLEYTFSRNGSSFTLIDTPGYDSPSAEDETFQRIFEEERQKALSCVLLLANRRDPGMNVALCKSLVKLRCLLPDDLMNNLVVVLTHCPTPYMPTLEFQYPILLEKVNFVYLDNMSICTNQYCSTNRECPDDAISVLMEHIEKQVNGAARWKQFQDAHNVINGSLCKLLSQAKHHKANSRKKKKKNACEVESQDIIPQLIAACGQLKRACPWYELTKDLSSAISKLEVAQQNNPSSSARACTHKAVEALKKVIAGFEVPVVCEHNHPPELVFLQSPSSGSNSTFLFKPKKLHVRICFNLNNFRHHR